MFFSATHAVGSGLIPAGYEGQGTEVLDWGAVTNLGEVVVVVGTPTFVASQMAGC